jgi:hypothetical protein
MLEMGGTMLSNEVCMKRAIMCCASGRASLYWMVSIRYSRHDRQLAQAGIVQTGVRQADEAMRPARWPS